MKELNPKVRFFFFFFFFWVWLFCNHRQAINNSDVECFIQWLTIHSPFEDRPVYTLVSLFVLIITNDSGNCDNAFKVRINSHEGMIRKAFAEVKLMHNSWVKSLVSKNNSVKIWGREVVVLPQWMLNCIIAVVDRVRLHNIHEIWTHTKTTFSV